MPPRSKSAKRTSAASSPGRRAARRGPGSSRRPPNCRRNSGASSSDHKALVEALARLLGRAGKHLLARVAAGSLRFRLLRGRPSHEKLYLLSGPSGSRVLTGSANLGRAAFEGWQHEILIVFDDKPAWRLFEGYYQRDWKDSVPIAPESLVVAEADGGLAARDVPLPLE